MATDVKVPSLGESITEGTLAQWLKKAGDQVAADEPVASLETDKVTLEVPSPVAGTLSELVVDEGETVEVGAVIARIDEDGKTPKEAEKADADSGDADADSGAGQSGKSTPASSSGASPSGAGENPSLRKPEEEPKRQESEEKEDGGSSDQIMTLSPAVRRAVLEHHVDPSKIKGSGKDGRITKDDVLAAAKVRDEGREQAKAEGDEREEPKEAKAPAPKAPASAKPAGERREERVRMSRLRQTVARRLKEAQNTAALLTTFNDVDMSAVMEARERYKALFEKKHSIRLGFMSFFVKAVALAIRDVPAVNAYIEGEEIVYHDYLDVSIAVSGPKGLVVPVVRNADSMTFAEIETAIADYGRKAMEGSLTVEEMQGGTFTISNGGVFGSLLSTPIVNPPQSAVLGMHRIEERPVAIDGEVVIRPMMYLALTYDHRLVDGREAVTFLVRLKEAIEDPMRLLIDL
jgi:2-oxoglutarate dehydrogenase E2 component (dihydrolipoamide succinyltransferase)